MAPGRRRSSYKNSYQIGVTIIKAKYFPENSSPVIAVKVGNQKKKTIVRYNTDTPFYNEYFVFNLKCSLDVMLSTKIEIVAYLHRFLGRLKFHGSVAFEVATVWDQPYHECYHKWAILTNPMDADGGSKGYVKCNIYVHTKGDRIRAHPETEGEDDIEGNLLLPIGTTVTVRQKAKYIFDVYRADGLQPIGGSNSKSSKINPVVEILFAGMQGTTSELKHTCAPRFNERIVFQEMYPSLCHRIKIFVKNGESGPVLAAQLLNLRNISNSDIYEFLPTFGPSFVHLYSLQASRGSRNNGDVCCGGTVCSLGMSAYRGRLLLSLTTVIDPPGLSSVTGVEVERTGAIVEKNLWSTEEYLLVGILFDVCMLDRRFHSSIRFEISVGNAGNREFASSRCVAEDIDDTRIEGERKRYQNTTHQSQTSSRISGSMDGKYNYIPLGSNKPCIYVKSWWPNTEWRLFNSNRLLYISTSLAESLEKLERILLVENKNAYQTYNDMISTLQHHCLQYLRSLHTDSYDTEAGTKLDRHRVNVCRLEIEKILKTIKINGKLVNNTYIKVAMIHAYKYLHKIQQLSIDPQHNLPDVFVWMLAGSSRVAFSRIPAARIMFSEEEFARGVDCGHRVNLFLQDPEDAFAADGKLIDYTAGKLELFLWLGNMKFVSHFWNEIPPGYEIDDLHMDVFPRFFKYNKSSKYQLRAHIFQGRFEPGMDASGLLDPFIKVIFHGHVMSTKVKHQALDPLWDQTLVFPPIRLHSTREHIKTFPTKVVLEAYDKDVFRLEFCGRCIATPLVKTKRETYSPPEFPPKLSWYRFRSQKQCTGAVLAAFELIEAGTDDVVDLPLNPSTEDKIYRVPDDIRPKITKYRMEVIFWGIRAMKKVGTAAVTKAQVVIVCSGAKIKSDVIENAKSFSNFTQNYAVMDLEMPEEERYYPSVTIKIFDSRLLGPLTYAGVCIIPSCQVFMRPLMTKREYHRRLEESELVKTTTQLLRKESKTTTVLPVPGDYDPGNEELVELLSEQTRKRSRIFTIFRHFFKRRRYAKEYAEEVANIVDDSTYDWWNKYNASLKEERKRELGVDLTKERRVQRTATFRPEFSSFQDMLRSFEFWKGKKTADLTKNERNFAGIFKGSIAIYRWPHPDNLLCATETGTNAAYGFLSDFPSQNPLQILVRIYVIKGINLQPRDPLSGKADPYLVVKLGSTHINESKSFIPNQLNPIFGKLFEINATLPKDYLLLIQVWDYDRTSPDDLIGETKIDIENRFYTKHRAHCGIARVYNASGYNEWRDREKPTLILEGLCRKNNLPLPEYHHHGVRIGRRKFPFTTEDVGDGDNNREESMALNVLHRWDEFPVCGCALVPEHVERRPLFNHSRPGLEQGKLELWIDMFQPDELPLKPAVNITPYPPEEYELRVIIWNTEDVTLVDSQFITGQKCSDIFVKGWINHDEIQKTDIHFNSLTGEGNFNWRFVFRFTWSRGESLMLVKKKLSPLHRDATEMKIPAYLNLQVWDADHFSPDDFLGALTLDIASMPKGSNNSKKCTLDILDPANPTLSIFKVGRLKSWWPFVSSTGAGDFVLAGKVEMEMILVPGYEADQLPVGRGREPPEPLPPPNRPDTSFSWFRNPWKAFRYIVCHYYKWRICCCCCVFLFVLLFVAGLYSFPRYFVKRLLGA